MVDSTTRLGFPAKKACTSTKACHVLVPQLYQQGCHPLRPPAQAPYGGAASSSDDLRLVEVGVRCSLEQMLEEGFYHAGAREKDGWAEGTSSTAGCCCRTGRSALTSHPLGPSNSHHTHVPTHPPTCPTHSPTLNPRPQTRTPATCCARGTASWRTWTLA